MKNFVIFLLFLTSCTHIKKLEVEGVKKKNSSFSIAWIKNHDPLYDTGNLPIALNSPLIYKDMVFSGSAAGQFNAYDLETGRTLWSEGDGGEFRSTPLGYKENIIYGNGQGRVFSRNALTGKLNYVVDLDESVEGQGVHYKGRLFFHTRNHKLFCLDIETGRILWAYKRSISFLTTMQRASTPLVHEGRVYVGFADGFVAAFNVEDGAMLWESRTSEGAKFVDVDSRPIFWNGKLVVPSNLGKLAFLSPQTGQVIRRIQHASYRSPLVLNNGNLLFGTVNGKILEIDRNLTVIQEVKVANFSISNIQVWKEGHLVSGMGRELLLLDKKFALVSKFDLGHQFSSVFGVIDVNEQYAAVLSSRNRLYLFR